MKEELNRIHQELKIMNELKALELKNSSNIEEAVIHHIIDYYS